MMFLSLRPEWEPSLERGGIILRMLFLIFLLTVLFALYLVRHPLLRLAGGFWVVDESPVPSDVIVILGNDNYGGERASRAAELFHAQWAPRIVASGTFLRPYADTAELEQHDLVDRGVPGSAIIQFAQRAQNTREEAAALSQFIVSHNWKRVLVVTSNYHTRRAQFILERTLPPGTQLRMIAAHDAKYDPDGWWRTREGVKAFLHECGGSLMALWEMRGDDVRTSAGN